MSNADIARALAALTPQQRAVLRQLYESGKYDRYGNKSLWLAPSFEVWLREQMTAMAQTAEQRLQAHGY